MKNFLNKKDKGFTLIEIIISLGIFSIVAVVAVGSLLRIIDQSKKAQTLKTVINNVNYALESMSREIRSGTNYVCNSSNFSLATGASLPSKQGCSALDKTWIIAFYSSKTMVTGGNLCHLVYAYRFANNTIEKAEQSSCTSPIDDSSFSPIISSDVVFDNAVVTVDVGNDRQSYVFFHLKGYAGSPGKVKSQSYFDVQTSVSQNLSD